jgi:hypothetical protein
MKEWLLAGYDPPFATVDEWISDLIGRLGAEEEAVYALRAREDGRPGIRIVLAGDIGLFDFFWYRPDDVSDRVLTCRLIPWRDVRGVALTSESRLNPSTLLRNEPVWRLVIEEPALTIESAPAEAVLLDFWKEVHKASIEGKAG